MQLSLGSQVTIKYIQHWYVPLSCHLSTPEYDNTQLYTCIVVVFSYTSLLLGILIKLYKTTCTELLICPLMNIHLVNLCVPANHIYIM